MRPLKKNLVRDDSYELNWFFLQVSKKNSGHLFEFGQVRHLNQLYLLPHWTRSHFHLCLIQNELDIVTAVMYCITLVYETCVIIFTD